MNQDCQKELSEEEKNKKSLLEILIGVLLKKTKKKQKNMKNNAEKKITERQKIKNELIIQSNNVLKMIKKR